MLDLPPVWVETYDKARTMLTNIDEKLKLLKSAQQLRIQTAFGDVKSMDREVGKLTSQITTVCF